jgi:hypothetical protein
VKKKLIGGKLKCLYNKDMYRTLSATFLFIFWVSAFGAQNTKHWYKVESPKKEKKKKTAPNYPYDSLEQTVPEKSLRRWAFGHFNLNLFWVVGFGWMKRSSDGRRYDRVFINASILFRNRPWHRLQGGFQLVHSNALLMGLTWEFTPSRERVRSYYGFGLSNLLVSDKEFRNFLEIDNYFATGVYGWEFLLPSGRGWNIEIKGYLGAEEQALQFSGGYIIPF